MSNPLPMLKLKAADKSFIHPGSEFYFTPAVNAIHKMLKYAKSGVKSSKGLIDDFNLDKFRKSQRFEEVLDICQIQLNNYIEKAIVAHERGYKLPIHISDLHHAVNDIEHIGDISNSLGKRALVISEYNVDVPDEEKKKMIDMFDKVIEMFDYVIAVIGNGSDKNLQKENAAKAYELENAIDEELREFRNDLRNRPMKTGYGWYITNISDIYADLENIGDKLKNVLEAFGFPELSKLLQSSVIGSEQIDEDEQN